MIKRITILPLILLLLMLVGPVAAQTGSPVQAELTVATGEHTVGDPIELTLRVIHPDDFHIILPQLEEVWGDLTVKAQSTSQTISNRDGTKTTTQTIDARLFMPGTFSTPPLPFKVTDGGGQLSEVVASPVPIHVSTVLVEGDTTLRDIKPQVEMPFTGILPWVVGLGLFAGAAGTFILWLWYKRRQRRVVVDNRLPHEIALDELVRIEQLGLPEEGRFKEHYSLVSSCIRYYIEQRFKLPALERTTAEIRVDLRKAVIDAKFITRLIEILNETDLVKFAKHRPQVPDAQKLVVSARAIIEMTKQLPALDVPDNDDFQVPVTVNMVMGESISKNGVRQHTEVNP